MIILDFLYLILASIAGYLLHQLLLKLKLSIPVSILAGVMIFIVKNNGLIELSQWFHWYPQITLAWLFIVFAINPTSSLGFKLNKQDRILLNYSWVQFFFQWSIGSLLTLMVVIPLFVFVESFFGIVLPAGFVGGHGTSLVVSSLLKPHGHAHYFDLTMTAATVGVLVAVTGGVWISHAGSQKEKKPMYWNAMQSLLGIEVLIILILSILAIAWKYFSDWLLPFASPVFVIAFIMALISKALLKKVNIRPNKLGPLGNVATDLLVLTGISMIELVTVEKYLFPLLILWLPAILFAWINLKWITPKIFKQDAFELGLFTWGWSIGGMAIGLALVKNVDPIKSQLVFEKFARIYPILAPVEIGLIFIGTLALVNGFVWTFAISTFVVFIGLLLVLRYQLRNDSGPV
jgi:ESS family glutamate:Na+ symporter